MKPNTLQLIEVELRLHRQTLLGPLTLEIQPGEVATLMGASGSGKSTLLSWLCGLLPTAFEAQGAALLGGHALNGLPPESRQIGILFQDDLLFPHMSVKENLLFALPRHIRSQSERNRQITEALQELGMPHFEPRDPATLSGGQRARIAVLRTLLSQPKALLLDEPFSKLDASTRQQFREFLFAYINARQLPTLLVTHDPADARAAGGQTIQLSKPPQTGASQFLR